MEFNPFHIDDDPGLPDTETHPDIPPAEPHSEAAAAPFTGFAVHPSLMPASPAATTATDAAGPEHASADAPDHPSTPRTQDTGTSGEAGAAQGDTAAASSSEAAQPGNTATPGLPAEVRQRRAVAVLALAAIAVFTMAAFTVGLPGAAPDPAAQSQNNVRLNAAVVPGQAQARSDLDKAAKWYRAHGTFLGLTSRGANIAGNDQRWTASRLTDGTCLTYSGTATSPAKAADILVDPSGKACSPGAVSAAAATLAGEQKQSDKAALATAGNALASFAQSVAQYTQANPSGLLGIPGSGAQEHITVISNTGSVLTARYTEGDTCIDAVIDAVGTIYDSYRCP